MGGPHYGKKGRAKRKDVSYSEFLCSVAKHWEGTTPQKSLKEESQKGSTGKLAEETDWVGEPCSGKEFSQGLAGAPLGGSRRRGRRIHGMKKSKSQEENHEGGERKLEVERKNSVEFCPKRYNQDFKGPTPKKISTW